MSQYQRMRWFEYRKGRERTYRLL